MPHTQQSRISGALSLLIAQATVLILGYVTHLWIGRVLGPGPYGVYGVVLSVQSIFGLLLTLGIPVAIARYVARDEKHAHSILRQGTRWQLLVAVTVAAIVWIGSPFIASSLNDSSLTPLILFVGFVILSQALYPVYAQFFSGIHKFNKQAWLTGIYAIAKVIGALSLIYAFGVYGAFAGFAVGGFVAGAIGYIWSRGPITDQTHRLPLQSFLSFAGLYVLILVGLQVLISIDLFMVKALLQDDVIAGYYNAAVTLSRIPYLLLQSLAFVLLPSVSKLTTPGASQKEAARFISDTIRYLIALIVPAVALAAATSKPLIILFFSRDYIPAAPALTILMIGLGALAFYLLLSNIIVAAGRTRSAFLLTLGLIAISATTGFFLIPKFGAVGAALQTTIAGVVGLAILGAYTFKTFKIPLPVRSIINIIIASAVAVAPTYVWTATPLTLVPQYCLSGILYLLTLFLLKEITAADVQQIAKIHPKIERLIPSKYRS